MTLVTTEPKRRHRGRPSKLTPERSACVFDLVQRGQSLERVAASVGISTTTLYHWLRLGRSCYEGRHYEFFAGLKKAQALFVDYYLDRIATDSDWMRWARLLSRKFPKKWARRRYQSPDLARRHSLADSQPASSRALPLIGTEADHDIAA
jgi:hypothetical protein